MKSLYKLIQPLFLAILMKVVSTLTSPSINYLINGDFTQTPMFSSKRHEQFHENITGWSAKTIILSNGQRYNPHWPHLQRVCQLKSKSDHMIQQTISNLKDGDYLLTYRWAPNSKDIYAGSFKVLWDGKEIKEEAPSNDFIRKSFIILTVQNSQQNENHTLTFKTSGKIKMGHSSAIAGLRLDRIGTPLYSEPKQSYKAQISAYDSKRDPNPDGNLLMNGMFTTPSIDGNYRVRVTHSSIFKWETNEQTQIGYGDYFNPKWSKQTIVLQTLTWRLANHTQTFPMTADIPYELSFDFSSFVNRPNTSVALFLDDDVIVVARSENDGIKTVRIKFTPKETKEYKLGITSGEVDTPGQGCQISNIVIVPMLASQESSLKSLRVHDDGSHIQPVPVQLPTIQKSADLNVDKQPHIQVTVEQPQALPSVTIDRKNVMKNPPQWHFDQFSQQNHQQISQIKPISTDSSLSVSLGQDSPSTLMNSPLQQVLLQPLSAPLQQIPLQPEPAPLQPLSALLQALPASLLPIPHPEVTSQINISQSLTLPEPVTSSPQTQKPNSINTPQESFFTAGRATQNIFNKFQMDSTAQPSNEVDNSQEEGQQNYAAKETVRSYSP